LAVATLSDIEGVKAICSAWSTPNGTVTISFLPKIYPCAVCTSIGSVPHLM
jgi:hypothetical protein